MVVMSVACRAGENFSACLSLRSVALLRHPDPREDLKRRSANLEAYTTKGYFGGTPFKGSAGWILAAVSANWGVELVVAAGVEGLGIFQTLCRECPGI